MTADEFDEVRRRVQAALRDLNDREPGHAIDHLLGEIDHLLKAKWRDALRAEQRKIGVPNG
jgi:hypothetical protein